MNMIRRQFISFFALALMMACVPQSQIPAEIPVEKITHIEMIGTAFWYENVFTKDVDDMSKAIKGASQYPVSIQKNSVGKQGLDKVMNLLGGQYENTAGRMKSDALMLSFFTTHGNKGVIFAGDENQYTDISAIDINNLFAPVKDSPHIIIIQACFSGSLIPELQAPNRIIMTAADADHSSFGCEPGSDNTWFVKALKAEIQKGRSWEQIFAATKARVTAYEKSQDIEAADRSNPQVFVGQNMKAIWQAPI